MILKNFLVLLVASSIFAYAEKNEDSKVNYSKKDYSAINFNKFSTRNDSYIYGNGHVVTKKERMFCHLRGFSIKTASYYNQCYYLTDDSTYLSILAYLTFLEFLETKKIPESTMKKSLKSPSVTNLVFYNYRCLDSSYLGYFKNPLLWKNKSQEHLPLPDGYIELSYKEYKENCKEFVSSLSKVKLKFRYKFENDTLGKAIIEEYAPILTIEPLNDKKENLVFKKIRELIKKSNLGYNKEGVIAESMVRAIFAMDELLAILIQNKDADLDRISTLALLGILEFYNKSSKALKELKSEYYGRSFVRASYRLWLDFYKIKRYNPDLVDLPLTQLRQFLVKIYHLNPSLFDNPEGRELSDNHNRISFKKYYGGIYTEKKGDYKLSIKEFKKFVFK